MKAPLHIIIYLLFVLVGFNINIEAQTSTFEIAHLQGISEELNAPIRITADEQGNIYVTDAFNKNISKFDAYGNFLNSISAVEQPVSLAVNKEGQLFIGDGATGKIYCYDQISGVTEFYNGTLYPSSMEIGPDNRIYVADSEAQQVIVLDLSGNVVQTIGSEILDLPTGIAVDHTNRRILVGEHGGSGTGFSPVVKVYMFDFQGTLVNSFGSHGSGDGKFYRIQGLTVGKCGHVYVVDPYQARVSVFDENGTFISKFGDFGLQAGQLNIPMDIVFDSGERILVSSMNNGAIELFSISDTLPSSTMKNSSTMICAGESTDIEVAFTGTAPWSFTYTIDGLNPTTINTSDNPCVFSVSEPGHYELIALSDANYSGTCFTGSAEVIVTDTPPTAFMSGDATICTGNMTEISIDLTGLPPWSFTYAVDGADPISVTTVNNPYILAVSEAGLYTGYDLIGGGCQGTSFMGSAEIIVNQLPSATMTDGNGQIIIDEGESVELAVELTGSPPWEITYTVDDENPVSITDISEETYIIVASKTGTYEVKEVTDSNCASAVSLGYPDLVLSSSVSHPSAQMDGGDLSICPGESVPISVLFTGIPPWTFTFAVDTIVTSTIFNTYTNPYIINAVYGGSYEILALSDSQNSGEDFTGYANVSLHSLPGPDFNYASDGLELSFSNTSLDADSYQWDFGDGNTSIEISPVHQYASAGEYIVTLNASNGLCGDSTIMRAINVYAVAVESIEFGDLLRIFPNPSKGLVTMEINNAGNSDMDMAIVDINGRIVYRDVLHPGKVIEVLDLSSFSSGVYFVKIRSETSIGIKKLILSTH